jgi:hypothetical protein
MDWNSRAEDIAANVNANESETIRQTNDAGQFKRRLVCEF